MEFAQASSDYHVGKLSFLVFYFIVFHIQVLKGDRRALYLLYGCCTSGHLLVLVGVGTLVRVLIVAILVANAHFVLTVDATNAPDAFEAVPAFVQPSGVLTIDTIVAIGTIYASLTVIAVGAIYAILAIATVYTILAIDTIVTIPTVFVYAITKISCQRQNQKQLGEPHQHGAHRFVHLRPDLMNLNGLSGQV